MDLRFIILRTHWKKAFFRKLYKDNLIIEIIKREERKTMMSSLKRLFLTNMLIWAQISTRIFNLQRKYKKLLFFLQLITPNKKYQSWQILKQNQIFLITSKLE